MGLFWDKEKGHRKAQLTKEKERKKETRNHSSKQDYRTAEGSSFHVPLFTLFVKARMQIGDNVQSLSKKFLNF